MLRVPKAAEMVATMLRNEIIRGSLREDASLPREAELVERFGLSRPTIREAIRILESEGLISLSRGARNGARIHAPRIDTASRYFGLILQSQEVTIKDIYQARMIIEPPAAEMLAQRRDPAHVEQLSAMISECRKHVGDRLLYGELTAQFHRKIVELAGNKTLSLLSDLLHDVLARSNSYVWSTPEAARDTSVRKESSLKARETLVGMIADGRAAEARDYSRENLEAIIRILDKWGVSGRVIDVLKDFP